MSIRLDADGATLEGFPSVSGPETLIRLSGDFSDLGPLSGTDVPSYSISGPNVQSLAGLPPRREYTILKLLGGRYTDLLPLQGVERIDSLSLSDTQLRSLHGLEDLRSIGNGAILHGNEELETLDALSGLERVDGPFELRENAKLTSLAGLEGVESMGRLSVRVCGELRSLAPVLGGALRDLDSLRVTFNEKLPQCEAESLCAQVPGAACDVTGNADLKSSLCP
jgi:hypothetical protein